MKVNRTLRRFLIAAAVVVLAAMLASPTDGRFALPRRRLPQAAKPCQAAVAGRSQIGSASHIQPLRQGFEFPYGQTLHYEGEWRFWTAGIATLRIERSGSQEHVSADGRFQRRGGPALSRAGPLQRLLRRQELCSYKLIKHTEEGSHRSETQYHLRLQPRQSGAGRTQPERQSAEAIPRTTFPAA